MAKLTVEERFIEDKRRREWMEASPGKNLHAIKDLENKIQKLEKKIKELVITNLLLSKNGYKGIDQTNNYPDGIKVEYVKAPKEK